MKIRPAAGVIPLRPNQVYLVQRGRTGRFFPGFHAFPGGALEEGDDDLRVCAARELWEETGFWAGPRQPPRELRATPWAELRQAYPLALEEFQEAGLRTTPAYALARFRAQFFVWQCPAEQWAEVSPGELDGGRWWGLEEAVEAWRRGEIFLAAPTQDTLLALLANDWNRLNGLPEDTPDPISVLPGLSYIPLETPTLPPARHTLCFVLGQDPLVLVDVAAADAEQCERVLRVVGGRQVEGVLFTHHHPDHVGGLEFCRAQGWPCWTHARTAEVLGGSWQRLVEEGDRWGEWRVLHTPGHASGHLALWRADAGILLGADLASGLSTILVQPPDGDMAVYLESLRRCIELRPQLVLPSHGGPFGPGSGLLEKTLAHRLEREARVVAALHSGGDLLSQAYADVSGPALELARLSLEAHLLKLQAEGRAHHRDGRWRPA